MKKVFLIFALIIVSFSLVNAQAPLAKGGKQVNLGVGFSGWGIPIVAGVDFGVHQDVTVGLEGSFRSYSQSIAGTNYGSTIVGISGNGNYHFNRLLEIPSKFDFYAGLNLGFYFWSTPAGYPGSGASGLGLGAQVGGRYFFNSKLALNLEFGGGNTTSSGKIGISYIF